jgi:hypothetical protein
MDGIKKYRNKYQGQRAWIVGNGPSIDRTPLDRLAEEYTFGINRIGQTGFVPTLYFCSTGYIGEAEYRADVVKTIDGCGLPFVCSNLMPILAREVGREIFWLECYFSSSEYRYVDPDPEWWNPVSIEEGKIANYGTSVFACSQILAYMGFNPIFLVGCDLGYREFQLGQRDPNHFGENYESGKFHRPQAVHDIDNPRYILSHGIIRNQAKKMGIDIYNATLGGELEVYERVEFFDVV